MGITDLFWCILSLESKKYWKFVLIICCSNEKGHLIRGVSKMKTYENEDRRPKMGLRNYENEDPLRKQRPIFVFVLRKRRPTTKTKTHLCFRTTKTKTIKYSFIRYFRENKHKSVTKNFR